MVTKLITFTSFNFFKSSELVKNILLKAHCFSFYAGRLWFRYKLKVLDDGLLHLMTVFAIFTAYLVVLVHVLANVDTFDAYDLNIR